MWRAAASLITGSSAVRSAGLMMIALAPDEIRLRMPWICALASPLTLWTSTSETWPEARAWAFTEQIISSRQPLPTSVLLTPILYIFLPPPLLAVPPLLLLSSPPQPAATTARTPTRSASSAMLRARRLMGTKILLLRCYVHPPQRAPHGERVLHKPRRTPDPTRPRPRLPRSGSPGASPPA